VDSITGVFTGVERSKPSSIFNKSAIRDHACNKKHVTDKTGEADLYRERQNGLVRMTDR